MPPPAPLGLFDDLVDPAPAPAPPAPGPAPAPIGLFDDLIAPMPTPVGDDRPPADAPSPPPLSVGDEVANLFGFQHDSRSLVDRAVNSKAGGFAAGLAPWLMGPVGIAAAAGTDVGDRYARMRELGYGPAASALAGGAQGAVELAAGPVAGRILGKPAAALGGAAAEAIGGRAGAAVGGAITHGVPGAGAGELMGLGTGTVSAAAGDPNAAAEFRSSGEQGLVLGALSAAAGGVGGGLAGRLAPAEDAAVAGEPKPLDVAAEPAAAPEATPAPGMFADLVEPAPAERPADVPPEAAAEGQTADTPVAAGEQPVAAGEPTGVFDDLVEPAPDATTEGGPAPSETTAPNEAPAEAAAHVQGAPGEPAPEDGGLEGEAGVVDRQPAAAGAAQAGDAPGRLLTPATEPTDAVRGRGRAGADAAPGTGEGRPEDAPAVPVPAPGDRDAGAGGAPVPAPVDAGVGGEPAVSDRAARPEAPAAPVAAGAPPARNAAPDAPVADQRATSVRPDLAIPAHEPAAREAFKAADQRRTAAGEPAVRSRASQTEAAAERVAADAPGEVNRIRRHVEKGGALSEQDAQILKIRVEQHVRAGDHAEAVKLAALYRRGKGEAARSVGSGHDPLEPAPKRAQRLVTDAMLEPDTRAAAEMDDALRRGDHAAYDRALDRAARQNEALLAEVKRLTGLDPHELAAGAEPKPQRPKPTVKERTQKAVLEVDREYRDLLKKFKDSFRSKSAGALGGEQLALLSQIISNRVKAGVLRAADAVVDLARMLPRIKRDREMQQAFADEWKKQTGETVDAAKLFEKPVAEQRKAALDQLAKVAEKHAAGDAAGGEPRAKRSRDPEVQAILDTAAELRAELRKQQAKPSPTLEQKVGAARDRLAAAVERHAEAMGQTDAERTATIAARRVKPQVEPEVQALMDEVARLGKDVRERDRKLEPPKAPPTLDEQVASAQEKLNAAIERHHAAMGQTPAERLAAIEAKKADTQAAKDAVHPEVQALLDQRKALDAEVRKRDQVIYRNAMRVLDAIATVKSDAWDKVHEYRRNVVHTSLRLPLKKVVSDAANTLIHMLTDYVGRPALNHLIPGGSDTASLKDGVYAMRGMMTGLRNGWHGALESWSTHRNVWQEQLAGARMQKAIEAGELARPDEFHQPRALTGKLGTATGWNIRAVGAFQTFAETLLAHMQVGAEAYRRAYDMKTGERLTGQALEDHMHRETSDLTSESWTKADTVSKDITGVTSHKTGPIAWLNELARLDVAKGKTTAERAWRRLGKEVARHTFLFRTLPFNFLVKGIYHLTPLNGATLLARGAKSLTGLALRKEGWSYSRAEFNTDAAKHAMAWAGMLAVSSLLDDEKGQPRITGFTWKPTDADLPAPPEHSIRWNGEWHDYTGAGPLGHALGTMVDLLRGVKAVRHGKSIGDAASEFGKSLGGHVVNETYLRGLRDLYEATQGGGKTAKFIGTFASSFYPTMFKDAGKATSGTTPDRQTKESGFWARTSQVAEQQLGVPGVQMTPDVDLFGKDIAKDDGFGGPITTWINRTLNPFTGPPDVRDGDADPYRKMLVKWNEEHPNDQLLPKTPSPYVMLGRKRIPLSPAQYHALCADSGQRLMGYLKDAGINTDNPTQDDIDAFKVQVDAAQREARDELKFQLLDRATAATGTPEAGASE